MGFLTISDPVGRSEGSFPPADFKIVNEIKGLEHISYGMAVERHFMGRFGVDSPRGGVMNDPHNARFKLNIRL